MQLMLKQTLRLPATLSFILPAVPKPWAFGAASVIPGAASLPPRRLHLSASAGKHQSQVTLPLINSNVSRVWVWGRPLAPVASSCSSRSLATLAAAESRVSDVAVKDSGGRKRKMMRIGTHNGTFHCDEALGCFLLKQTAKFRDAEIVRSRDKNVLDSLDAVIDVGGIYDPSSDRFDHHQRGFDQVFGHGFNTKLSSAGLVYKHYGQEVVASRMKLPEDHPDVLTVYLAVYRGFMEAIDAIDNGINQYDTTSPPRYQSSTHLSARVGRLNPSWLQAYSEAAENEAFFKAMQLAGGEFVESVDDYATSWLPARSIVMDSILAAKEVYPTGEIIVLKSYCPWKSHLALIEKEKDLNPLPKYVIYQDEKGHWRVQAVSVSEGSFESRKPLAAAWRGVRDEDLSEKTGMPGCIFVHSSGFIGGNETLEGALAMARISLELE